MNTPEKALYDRAKALAQDGTGDCAYLFDLSHLDGIEDPVLSKAASDVIDARIGQTQAEAFALSGHRWMYLGSHEAIDVIEKAVKALSAEMSARKMGEIRNVRFDLSRHAQQFLDQCESLAKEQAEPAQETAASMGTAEEFIDLVKIKARLQGVDFSPMIRRCAVWHAAPETSAARIGDQILIQNATVKKLFSIDLDFKDWITQKIDSLFSRYLVWSLLREYRHGGRGHPPAWIPITPDLLSIAEMQAAFHEMHAIAAIGPAAPDILRQAAADAEQAKIPLALILPGGQAAPANIPDYVHFIISPDAPDPDLAARWVLASDDEDKVQASLTNGVQYFASAAPPEAAQGEPAPAANAPKRLRREEKPAPKRIEDEEPAPQPAKTGLFSRMRSWMGRPAPDAAKPDSK